MKKSLISAAVSTSLVASFSIASTSEAQATDYKSDNSVNVAVPGQKLSENETIQGGSKIVHTKSGGDVYAISIPSNTSAHQYSFDFDIPNGGRLLKQSDGSVFIIDATGSKIGTIKKPWAKDAKGNSLSTSYSVSGKRLVQSVNFSSSTAFPVTADPHVTFGLGVYVHYDKGDVNKLVSAMNGTLREASPAICGLIGNAGGTLACTALSIYSLNKIKNAAVTAQKQHRCMVVRVVATYVSEAKPENC